MQSSNEIIKDSLKTVAGLMLVAAQTAPKARGIDNLKMAILEKSELPALIKKMKEIFEREGAPVFGRDAESLDKAEFLFLIGTKTSAIGLKYCGLCGFKDCAELQAQEGRGVCIFNPGDLGIALGSAVAVAAAHHVDNRIMYSAGMAAIELGILGKEVKMAFGVPLSAGPKNPFFDRK